MRELIEKTVKHFKQGDIVVFPTDTVYGIGCISTNPDSIKKLYTIKKREENKPTHLLISNLKQAEKYSEIKDKRFEILTKEFWPGGLTIILPAKENTPDLITGQSDLTKTIGLRMPNHPYLLEIIEKVGEPILGPSANFAGEKPPASLNEVDKEFLKLVDFYIDFKCGGQEPSTIIDITKGVYRIIRMGTITLNQINTALKKA